MTLERVEPQAKTVLSAFLLVLSLFSPEAMGHLGAEKVGGNRSLSPARVHFLIPCTDLLLYLSWIYPHQNLLVEEVGIAWLM